MNQGLFRFRATAPAIAVLVTTLAFAPTAGAFVGYNLAVRDEGDLQTTVNSLRLDVLAPVGPVLLEAKYAVLFGTVGDDDETQLSLDGDRVKSNNLALAVYLPLYLELIKFRVGVGATVPLATVSEAGIGRIQDGTIYATAAAGRGLRDYWLYAPDTFAAFIPARLEVDLGLIALAADGALAWYIPTKGDPVRELSDFPTGGTDAAFGFQLGGEGIIGFGPLGVGARLLVASILGNSLDDAQLSVEPLARLGLGPVGLEAAFLLNLTEPHTSLTTGGTWGFRVGLTVDL